VATVASPALSATTVCDAVVTALGRRIVRSATPILHVKDVIVAVRWSGDVLGFRPVAIDASPAKAFAIVRRDAIEIFLQKGATSSHQSPSAPGGLVGWPSRPADVYMRVGDLEAMHGAARTQLDADLAIESTEYGYREFRTVDRDDHVIVIAECVRRSRRARLPGTNASRCPTFYG
jgi:hypothetical protein